MMRFIPFVILLLCASGLTTYCQEPDLTPDPSGATQIQVPQGWKVETRQEGGAYLWLASASDQPDAPGVMQLVVPDQPGPPEAFLRLLLEGTVEELRIDYRHGPSPDEGHFLGQGVARGGPVQIAALVIRDPGQFLFLNLLSARPADFQRLGAENLLYRMLGQRNPFDAAVEAPASRQPAAPLHGVLNMQDPAVKEAMLQHSAPLETTRLHGQWLQVFGLSTAQVYQQLNSGEVFSGSRGQAHLLDLMADGRYALSYLYHSSGACLNRAEITETGHWNLRGSHLTLRPDQYGGTLTVCGKASREQKSRPPARTFAIGMDGAYRHLTLQGKPLEYTVSTQTDDQGNALFLEGFVKQ